jgi:hypothetical protein
MSRFTMNCPIKSDLQFQSVITKRALRRFTRPKYCAYTRDGETLLLASDRKTNLHSTFTISLDATNISRKNSNFMGIVRRYSNQFVAFSWHPQQDQRRREMILIRRKEISGNGHKILSDDVLIPTPGWELLVEPWHFDEIPAEKCLRLVVSEHVDESIVGLFDDSVCFELKQITEDEFTMQVGYPLSFFQAFVLALARMN